jgi:enolase-phosphatase E1
VLRAIRLCCASRPRNRRHDRNPRHRHRYRGHHQLDQLRPRRAFSVCAQTAAGVYIETHGDLPEVLHWLHEAASEAGLVEASRQDIIELLLQWIDEDRKSTALKALQGMIWKDGYVAGDYRAHIYPEVAARLRSWRADGLHLYVYSSGSVPAQQLFFRYNEAGDLTPLFAGYFDTETGPKREAESYRRIAEAIGEQPGHILFLSYIEQELDAAQAAGFHTGWLIRPPLEAPATPSHAVYHDFDAIKP